MDIGTKDKQARSPGENGGKQKWRDRDEGEDPGKDGKKR